MHPDGLEPPTYSSVVCKSLLEKLRYFSGLLQGSVLAVDQNRAKVASSPVTDAGGNLWTCYQQLRLFVTSTLANLFEIADRRSSGST